MPHVFRFRSTLDLPVSEVFAWHERVGAFERLTPPWQDTRVLAREGGIQDGATLEFSLGLGPVRVPWLARLSGYEKDRLFVDVQERGPFRSWEHRHHFLPEGDRTLMEDEVTWELPGGPLEKALAAWVEKGTLLRMFAFRHARLRRDLEVHHHDAARHAGTRLRVAVTGATGLIGRALVAFLQSGGHEVIRLVRRAAGPGEVRWDPSRQEIDASALEGLDAVVHLAGEPVAGRWTRTRKENILQSRVLGTRLLAATLPRLARPPAVWVSGSAVGWYGDSGDVPVDEESPPGKGFLAEVCRAWEAEATPACDAGIRVVHPRIGIVTTSAGGALGQMLPAFSAGAGGPMGNGRAFTPWIALDDVLYGILHLIRTPTLRGPVNLVGPDPLPNKDFAKTLGRVLGRPAILPTPAPALRALFGEMADEALLAGQRALPRKLTDSGYVHAFGRLEDALRFELGR